MSSRALPSLPTGAVGVSPVPPTGTIGRVPQKSDTMRHAPPVPEHVEDEEDQMLEGVIIPAINGVSLSMKQPLTTACGKNS